MVSPEFLACKFVHSLQFCIFCRACEKNPGYYSFCNRKIFSFELSEHKVLTYIKYRAVSGVFRTIDPPPPLHPASVSSPRTKGGGGGHTRRAVRGGGV
jgi:hypothetical protein